MVWLTFILQKKMIHNVLFEWICGQPRYVCIDGCTCFIEIDMYVFHDEKRHMLGPALQ